jgi:membrane glycosyltransferase
MMIAQTVFIGGLMFGQRVIWEAQNREERSVSLPEAIHGLWPQMLFGAVGAALLWIVAPGAILWGIPTLGPCLLAVPFTCITSSRPFGRALVRLRLCAIPDEVAPAGELQDARRAEVGLIEVRAAALASAA